MGAPSRFSEWREPFLTNLRATGNVRASALAAGVHPQTPYRLRKSEPDFACQWEEALVGYRAGASAALGSCRPGALSVVHSGEVGADGKRAGAHRWCPSAARTFLTELGATGSVQGAAEACGFSTTALYRRKASDAAFAKAWEAAREMGKGRLADHLLERATRAFDPAALPVAGEMPSVSTREAIAIMQQAGRPSTGLRASAGKRGQTYEEMEASVAEVEEVRGRIVAKLERLREKTDRHYASAGWSEVEHEGETCWIPPGYGKL